MFTKENAQKLIDIVSQGAKGTHLGVVRSPEYIKELDAKIKEAKTKEEKRAALRDRDMAYRGWTRHEIDFSVLPEAEQKAALILIEKVLPAVEAVNFLQLDPNNIGYLNQIASTGNFADYLHAYNSGGPWCQEIKEAVCTSMASGAPARVPNAGMWPKHFTETDYDKIAADLEASQKRDETEGKISRRTKDLADLLSNFVVSPDGKNWQSVNADPRLKPYLERISIGLREAATVPGIDATLRKFFVTRAAEFEKADTAFPFFDGDVAWTVVKGGLDVTLGFYESYKSPFEHNAMMEAYVVPLDAGSYVLGERFQGLVPAMESLLAKEMQGYTPRDFSKGMPALKFANLITSGDPRMGYVPAAYYLPNIPPHGDASISKKVFSINNLQGRFDGVMKGLGDVVVHPSQRNITAADVNIFVVGHENAHGVGVDRSLTNGLREFSSALEEAKADMEGIASLPMAVAEGIITQDQADRAYIGLLYSFLRGLAYGMNDAHGIGNIIEFVELYKAGAIVEKEGFYAVNLQDNAVAKASK
ncbi:MAG: hypothetical protein U1D33_02460, partial [bacterium]|nr:hypothetical protein [bacterium]